MRQKPNTWAVLAGAAIAAVLTFTVIQPWIEEMFEDSKTEDVGAALRKTASQLNENTPSEVDADTRLDRVTTESRTLVYHYTITTQDAAHVDPNNFDRIMRFRILSTVCAQMKYLIDLGATVVYSYSGRDAQPIASIVVEPSDC